MPDKYWHVYVKLIGAKDRDYAVANDLSFEDVQTKIVSPWHAGSAFPVSGKVVPSVDKVQEIKITQTADPKAMYSERHYAHQRASNVVDMATDVRLLPIWQGTDHTHELLFKTLSARAPEPDVGLLLTLCQRLPFAARILATRDRAKSPFEIADEYDVQDLLHSVIRAYLKYSVHEEPLGKIGGGKSGRADVAIEDIGTIVEVKYVRGPKDQQRLVEEFAQDLLLYTKWPQLAHFIYLVYNSADLRDAEALLRLEGDQEINGVKFRAYIVLA
jgi:hypothetical protein